MNEYNAFIIGVLTIIIIFLIFYVFSLTNQNVATSYNKIFCNPINNKS